MSLEQNVGNFNHKSHQLDDLTDDHFVLLLKNEKIGQSFVLLFPKFIFFHYFI
jgi:hypothetical protein